MGTIRNDLTGKVFSRLTVTNKYRNKDKRTQWLCKCSCGEEKYVDVSCLTKGDTLSCGCYGKEQVIKAKRLPNGEAAFNKLYLSYQASARKRGIRFALSKETFKELTSKPCLYCGELPSRLHKNRKIDSYGYLCNGVDRADNSIGYTIDNTVPCCKTCNYMKHTNTEKEWVLHMKKILTYLGEV